MLRRNKAEPDQLAAHIEAGDSVIGLFQVAHDTLKGAHDGLAEVKAKSQAVIADESARITEADAAMARQAKVISKLSEFTA